MKKEFVQNNEIIDCVSLLNQERCDFSLWVARVGLGSSMSVRNRLRINHTLLSDPGLWCQIALGLSSNSATCSSCWPWVFWESLFFFPKWNQKEHPPDWVSMKIRRDNAWKHLAQWLAHSKCSICICYYYELFIRKIPILGKSPVLYRTCHWKAPEEIMLNLTAASFPNSPSYYFLWDIWIPRGSKNHSNKLSASFCFWGDH